jgi:peptidyl-prolyl cis-trans isomerase D
MISLLRRYRRPLFIAVITIFLIGTFVGLGGYLFTSRDMSQAVASVGPSKIPYSRYSMRVNQYLDALKSRGAEIKEEEAKQVKRAMLQDMIVDEILLAKADKMGLAVTDEELSRDIHNTPAFQREGVFDQEIYFRALTRVLHESPEGYEESRRRQLKAYKLKQLLYQAAKLSPEEIREAYAEAHKGSAEIPEKERDAFAERLRQQRAIDLINYYLRQMGNQIEIHSYLEQRESGI